MARKNKTRWMHRGFVIGEFFYLFGFFESKSLSGHGFMLGQTGGFFSCQYGVDYLPSVVLLNEDSRSYVRGFFLNNKYQYNASAYH